MLLYPRYQMFTAPNVYKIDFFWKKGPRGAPNVYTKVSSFEKNRKVQIICFIFRNGKFHIFIFLTKLVSVVWPFCNFRLYGRFLYALFLATGSKCLQIQLSSKKRSGRGIKCLHHLLKFRIFSCKHLVPGGVIDFL